MSNQLTDGVFAGDDVKCGCYGDGDGSLLLPESGSNQADNGVLEGVNSYMTVADKMLQKDTNSYSNF